MVAIKALACELPAKTDTPLARWQSPDLARAAVESGIVASISGTTIWRWLSADAIKPWQHRSWIFPRDPDFGAKAARRRLAINRRLHKLCRFHEIQPAVIASHNNDRVVVMPGLYTEPTAASRPTR